MAQIDLVSLTPPMFLLIINIKDVVFVHSQKELVLYPVKCGRVRDLLDEALKQLELDSNGVGSGKLR